MTIVSATQPSTARLFAHIENLIRVPTAPFREQWMCARLDATLARIPGLQVEVDRFGNRIVRMRRGAPSPVTPVFVAHLDHPGFIFPKPQGAQPVAPRRYEARFEGRLDSAFFEGAAVRLFRSADDPGVAGRILSATAVLPETDNRLVVIETVDDADGAVLGMWDINPFELDGDEVRTRACDDLISCGVLIEVLERLSGEADVDLGVIFSRAEEAGFCGVICLVGSEPWPALLPRESVFVSVETSSERPGVQMGEGAVIRVGDRSSTFDGYFTDSLWTVAREHDIRARRALMDGGTCEATAFARAGLRAGAVCVPVRNYHNQDRSAGRIGPEIVSASDVEALTDLICTLARRLPHGFKPQLPAYLNFDMFERKGREQLQA